MSHHLALEAAYLGCTHLTSHHLLATLPRGAYTTARTLRHGTAVLALPAHIARTHATAAAMLAQGPPPHPPLGSPEALGVRLRACLAALLRGAAAAAAAAAATPAAPAAPAATEYKLTILLLWGEGAMAQALAACSAPAAAAAAAAGAPTLLLAHASPLLPPRAPPIACSVRGAPRANPAAKDSAWVRARGALEAAMAPGEEEALLADASGCITEGTQTNFFAVDAAGRVCTAGEGACLAGTVRGLALEACAALGVAAAAEGAGPCVAQARSWRGAFLTSTSRLVLPVDELQWEEGGQVVRLALGSRGDDTVRRVQRAVLAAAEAGSETVV